MLLKETKQLFNNTERLGGLQNLHSEVFQEALYNGADLETSEIVSYVERMAELSKTVVGAFLKEQRYHLDSEVETDVETLKENETTFKRNIDIILDYVYRIIDSDEIVDYTGMGLRNYMFQLETEILQLLEKDGYDIYIVETIETAVETSETGETWTSLYKIEKEYETIETTLRNIEIYGIGIYNETGILKDINNRIGNIEKQLELMMISTTDEKMILKGKDLLHLSIINKDEITLHFYDARLYNDLK